MATQRVQSEKAAAYWREVIELLLDFAVGEGVIISNSMGVGAQFETPSLLGDLAAHKEIIRGRAELRRDECLRDAGRADG